MAVKYSAGDKDVFLQILAGYPINENKKTDAINIDKKKVAWEKITVEYNAVATEQRTMIQLKILCNKMKRNRKSVLAEERRELMATGGGPPPLPPPPQPEIDNLLPHLEFEIDNEDDYDGIILHKNMEVSLAHVVQEGIPIPLYDSDRNQKAVVNVVEAGTSEPPSALDLNPVADTPTVKATPKQKKNNLNELTQARLQLIVREKEQMEELHKVRIEEATYKKEAARLVMLQEEEKLKRIIQNKEFVL